MNLEYGESIGVGGYVAQNSTIRFLIIPSRFNYTLLEPLCGRGLQTNMSSYYVGSVRVPKCGRVLIIDGIGYIMDLFTIACGKEDPVRRNVREYKNSPVHVGKAVYRELR
jgi:hypothetical protein